MFDEFYTMFKEGDLPSYSIWYANAENCNWWIINLVGKLVVHYSDRFGGTTKVFGRNESLEVVKRESQIAEATSEGMICGFHLTENVNIEHFLVSDDPYWSVWVIEKEIFPWISNVPWVPKLPILRYVVLKVGDNLFFAIRADGKSQKVIPFHPIDTKKFLGCPTEEAVVSTLYIPQDQDVV